MTLRSGQRSPCRSARNGSGKTTMLKLLCGILAPQAGDMLCDGRHLDSFEGRDLARRLGVGAAGTECAVRFHRPRDRRPGPYTTLDVGPTRLASALAAQALDMTETRSLAGRLFGELSGGEQQRVAIAMALAQIGTPTGGPPILLLDADRASRHQPPNRNPGARRPVEPGTRAHRPGDDARPQLGVALFWPVDLLSGPNRHRGRAERRTFARARRERVRGSRNSAAASDASRRPEHCPFAVRTGAAQACRSPLIGLVAREGSSARLDTKQNRAAMPSVIFW